MGSGSDKQSNEVPNSSTNMMKKAEELTASGVLAAAIQNTLGSDIKEDDSEDEILQNAKKNDIVTKGTTLNQAGGGD